METYTIQTTNRCMLGDFDLSDYITPRAVIEKSHKRKISIRFSETKNEFSETKNEIGRLDDKLKVLRERNMPAESGVSNLLMKEKEELVEELDRLHNPQNKLDFKYPQVDLSFLSLGQKIDYEGRVIPVPRFAVYGITSNPKSLVGSTKEPLKFKLSFFPGHIGRLK